MRAHENPFRTERIEGLAFRPPDPGWQELLRRLETASWRGAAVGPPGSGKTTFLEALAPRLAARGFEPRFVRLSEEAPVPPSEAFEPRGPRDFVLLDGAEQLGSAAWRRAASGPRLVISSHRPGRLPTLLETRSSPELAEALLVELLGGAAEAWRERARQLLTSHRGNLREVWRSLYDACAAV